jgi:nucleotide-binding universal stress UspA family protein
MFTNILLPTDGSEVAAHAVDAGLELAKQLGAKVTFVTVVRPPQLNPAEAERALATAAARAEAAGVPATGLVRTGNEPADEIIAAAAETGADMIVMGSHGRSGIAAVLLGSQTELVTKHAKVPVLVYR